ncbi:hypothetical protein INR49_032792, partial [Caranx melampygus]
ARRSAQALYEEIRDGRKRARRRLIGSLRSKTTLEVPPPARGMRSAPPDALFPRTALSRLIQHCEPSLACRWLLPLTVELEPPRVPVCTTGPWGQASRDGLNPSSANLLQRGKRHGASEPCSGRL